MRSTCYLDDDDSDEKRTAAVLYRVGKRCGKQEDLTLSLGTSMLLQSRGLFSAEMRVLSLLLLHAFFKFQKNHYQRSSSDPRVPCIVTVFL